MQEQDAEERAFLREAAEQDEAILEREVPATEDDEDGEESGDPRWMTEIPFWTGALIPRLPIG